MLKRDKGLLLYLMNKSRRIYIGVQKNNIKKGYIYKICVHNGDTLLPLFLFCNWVHNFLNQNKPSLNVAYINYRGAVKKTYILSRHVRLL